MPKQSFVTTIHPNTATLYNAIVRQMRIENYRQEDLGKALHIKQNTVCHHLKHHSFSQDQINDALDFLNMEIRVCEKS